MADRAGAGVKGGGPGDQGYRIWGGAVPGSHVMAGLGQVKPGHDEAQRVSPYAITLVRGR